MARDMAGGRWGETHGDPWARAELWGSECCRRVPPGQWPQDFLSHGGKQLFFS